MSDIESLNPEQKEAVCNFKGPTMILAGAGTGKTRVITTRIAWMISQGIDPRKIAAMTFTNKAAREMRERISRMTAPEVGHRLSISTFHSFCLFFLRSWPVSFGLRPRFTLVGTSDQQDLVRRALDEKGWSGLYRPDELHYQIGQCKNWLVSPEDLRKGRTPPHLFIPDPELLSVIYTLYERQLCLNRAIDFDDCILKVARTLQTDEQLREKINKRFNYYLVDEFQDTNAGQFAVLEELTRQHRNVCVVGDDDQSIYSWRGAMYETLERFEKVFPKTRLIRLEQNYRCSNVILHAANTVIRNNQQRKEKTLWSRSGCQTPIILRALEDNTEEARFIAGKCQSFRGLGQALTGVAILYRANSQAKSIEMALKEVGVPYKTYGGQSFFERKEIKDFTAYLRLVLNTEDRLALWRVINVPSRGIGLKTQEKLEELAHASGKTPWGALNDPALLAPIGRSAQEALCGFTSIINQLRTLPIGTPEQCVTLGGEIIRLSGLSEQIRKEAKHVHSRQHKIQNLMSLPAWIGQTASRIQEERGSRITREALTDSLCLGDEKPPGQDEKAENRVSLMTIHAAKGLEFPVVFLAGLEEGLMPHKNSLQTEEQICEERRLFYVALTRAKRDLILSWARLRQSGFQKENRKISRFLEELPDDRQLVAKEDDSVQTNPQTREATNRLGTLKKLAGLSESFRKPSG